MINLRVFQYLVSKNLIKSTDYLNVVQAGTEVIKATSVTTLKTTFYNTDINTAVSTPVTLTKPQCGLVDNITTPDGTYTLYNNLWGISKNLDVGVTGSQCSVRESVVSYTFELTTHLISEHRLSSCNRCNSVDAELPMGKIAHILFLIRL